MRPKIDPSHSIAKSLNYNEQKLAQGKAELLTAGNFLLHPSSMNTEEKLRVFQRRMELNPNVSVNQHITLNFDPSDKLTNERMKEIADIYMKEIGFGEQPYLVYRHHDAGHPHCHIVTTHVRENGDIIDMYNIGRNQSEKARQLIEKKFHLTTAEMKKQRRLNQKTQTDPNYIPRVIYGETAITPAISKVLDHVMRDWHCKSLQEFNTILALYNIQAWRGSEKSKLYQSRGLLYRVRNKEGKYTGVPIKASFFDSKPTLDNLEKQFIQNQSIKPELEQKLTNRLAWVFHLEPETLEEFTQKLAREDIRIILRIDKTGTCTGITYIDFNYKCIFTDAELQDRYGHKAVQKIIDYEKDHAEELKQRQAQRQTHRLRIH